LVESHARPGGNVTGILNTLDTLPGKQLEVAYEILTDRQGAVFVVNMSNPTSILYRAAAEAAASGLGAKLGIVEVRSEDDLEQAFMDLSAKGTRIALFLQDAMFLRHRRKIAALALASRIPTIYGFREHVEEGGLVSYGIDLRESWRRAAAYVGKILTGESPGEIPVELPTKLELVINQTTAKILGVQMPPSLIGRADEVVE
jgi:putative ABC transport system substrate-binding protein